MFFIDIIESFMRNLTPVSENFTKRSSNSIVQLKCKSIKRLLKYEQLYEKNINL